MSEALKLKSDAQGSWQSVPNGVKLGDDCHDPEKAYLKEQPQLTLS